MSRQYKKLTSHGSLSIPVAIRRELGLEARDPVELDTTPDGKILIKPYQLRCNFCGTTEQVEPLCGKGICPDCARRAMERIKDEKGL